jgi:hypothetical protein
MQQTAGNPEGADMRVRPLLFVKKRDKRTGMWFKIKTTS